MEGREESPDEGIGDDPRVLDTERMGRNLRAVRIYLGIPPALACQAIGIKYGQLKYIERGLRTPSFLVALKIAILYDTPIEEWVYNDIATALQTLQPLPLPRMNKRKRE